jgi:hypothetical protein
VLSIALGGVVLTRLVLSSDQRRAGSSPTPAATGRADSTAQPNPGTYRVDRAMYDDGANSMTLTSIEVLATRKMKVNIRYQSHSTVPWPLTCPAAGPDLQSSYLAFVNGQRVYPENTWCTAESSGQTFPLQPGAALDSWGLFPSAPPRGSRFSLNWYNVPTVEGLIL